ncbi:MAG: PstS family phosphate ABC transporter substrate-binding protein [Planctomycetaceae bacterium]|nr:PstS family phosphate ABC transporter substrate-binding protein [Planctomycetaceae bacterium]
MIPNGLPRSITAQRWILGTIAAAALSCGCIKAVPSNAPGTAGGGGGEPGQTASATIDVSGSSTVYPITQAMAVEYKRLHEAVSVSVAETGTTAGFKKLIERQAAICNASRPITDVEIAACKEKGIEYIELQVAIDGLSVVVNPKNDWVKCITTEQLKTIWDKDSTVQKWSDVDPAWPDEPLKLFGAGTQSGTFDYFTEAINGKARQCRTDYSQSENDNVLVEGVAGDKFAMGFFGFAYFAENQDQLRALAITHGDQATCVLPTAATILSGEYTPLSRPLFIYVNKEELKRPEVAQFVEYFLSDDGQALVEKKQYIKVPADRLAEMRQRLADAK